MVTANSNPPHLGSADSLSPQDLLHLQSAALTAVAYAVVITDRDGRTAWVNPAFTDLTGYSLAESKDKNLRELVKSDQQDPSVYRELWETILGGLVWRGELLNRRKDGSLYSEELSITPVRNEAGTVTHFIGIKRDLTILKDSAAKIRASELRYRRLFESAKDGILILDAETGMVVDANPFLVELLGFSLGDFLGKQIWDLGFFRDIVANKASFGELQRNDYIRYDDKPLETSDGRKIDVEFISNVYLVNNLRVIQCNIRDITARKAADRLIKDQSDILSNSHEGVMILNPANRITLWNQGASEIFGWTKAEAMDRLPDELLGIKSPALKAVWLDAVEKDGFWNGEMEMKTRAGTRIIVEVRTTRILNSAGQTRAILSFLADITEKKHMAEKFLHAQRLESIGMLAAGIAHDLNNVLSPITFAAPLLRNSLSDPADRRILSILEQSSVRGTNLVKQILGFARNSSGEFSPTQVKHLLRDVVGIIEETFPKSIKLRQNIPSELWTVLGNATQIHQVLMNLCINARDAMPDGGTLTITAANRSIKESELCAHAGTGAGTWIVLEVADTGSGIPPEIRDQIWDPFFTTKREGKGTGLGLSTVSSIVRQHHGFVELLPAKAQGSTFRVSLPATQDLPAIETSELDTICLQGHGECILVVDDDTLIRGMIGDILDHHGYRTEVCANGLEALAFFGAHPENLSLLITDVDMPLLGGLELARALHRVRPDIRVLVMSGLAHNANQDFPGDEHKDLASAFLLKPFTPQELLLAVHSLYHPAKPCVETPDQPRKQPPRLNPNELPR